MEDKFSRVCVIGVGLIGGSIALGMRRLGLADEIVGFGRTERNLKDALRIGAITSFTRRIERAVDGCDLIILAVPVLTMPKLVKSARKYFREGAILTDVGSTKANLIKVIEPMLDERVEFVPAHPIAGREKSGARYSDPEIFRTRWTIITPARSTTKDSLRKIKQLWEKLGSKVEVMKPELHDRIMAYVSHLPHIVAYSLVGALLEIDQRSPLLRFSAGGFRDFTRIAESSPEMWRDICLENREEIIKAIEKYEKEIAKIKHWIRKGKGLELKNFFARCKEVKERI